MHQLCLVFNLLLITIHNVVAVDTWSFIVLADWHGAESFAKSPVNDTYSNNTFYNETLDVLRHINTNYGGELVIFPGDTNDGKWYTSALRDELSEGLGYSSDLSIKQGIDIAGTNCYSTVKRLFSEAGYDKILVAIGDHEIG